MTISVMRSASAQTSQMPAKEQRAKQRRITLLLFKLFMSQKNPHQNTHTHKKNKPQTKQHIRMKNIKKRTKRTAKEKATHTHNTETTRFHKNISLKTKLFQIRKRKIEGEYGVSVYNVLCEEVKQRSMNLPTQELEGIM